MTLPNGIIIIHHASKDQMKQLAKCAFVSQPENRIWFSMMYLAAFGFNI